MEKVTLKNYIFCSKCKGDGYVKGVMCKKCSGSGYVRKLHSLEDNKLKKNTLL